MPDRPKKQRDRKELGFFEHLDELRIRLIRSVAYVAAGTIGGWVYRQRLLEVLRRPADVGAKAVGLDHLPFRVFEPAGGLFIALQVAAVAGLIAASPLIFWEVWRFVEPALEDHERRWAIIVLPAAVLLFFGGVAFCYAVMPRAFAFLFTIDQSLGVEVERTLRPYLWFIMRMMLGFGAAFEMPLVLAFLGSIGVVSARQLLRWWRHAIVLIFVAAAIITPTVDPLNMTVLAGPLVGLYFLSIALVWLVQRQKRWEESEEDVEVQPASAPDSSWKVYEQAHANRQSQVQPPKAETLAEEDAELPPPQDRP